MDLDIKFNSTFRTNITVFNHKILILVIKIQVIFETKIFSLAGIQFFWKIDFLTNMWLVVEILSSYCLSNEVLIQYWQHSPITPSTNTGIQTQPNIDEQGLDSRAFKGVSVPHWLDYNIHYQKKKKKNERENKSMETYKDDSALAMFGS